MAEVLHISASPRGGRSKSPQVARAFLAEYRNRAPDDKISELNIFTTELPDLDGPALQTEYNLLHGQQNSETERRAWSRVEAVIQDFKSVDKYVVSVPMWNFGIPYRLRHHFDFRDAYEDFVEAGAVVIGISGDSAARHQAFASNHQLPFVLVSDADGKARHTFGVPKSLGLLPGRVTCVIDKEGVVRHVFSSQFAADRHAKEALDSIGELNV